MKRMAAILFGLAIGIFLFSHAMAAPQGKVIIARGGWVTTLDPHLETNFVLTVALPNLFDTLLTRDPRTGKILPHLATSYRYVSPTILEFKLRKGVRFTNGEKVNAEAVKFSFERILNPANKSRQFRRFKSIDRVEILDTQTVRFHTKAPDATLVRVLADWGFIAPPKYYSSHDKSFLARNPIGSGPYKLVRWKRREEIVYEAKSDYWKPGVPKIKTAIIKEVPEAASRVAALLGGTVDLADRVPPQMVQRIRYEQDLEAINYFIPRVAGLWMVVKQKPLTDVRVRQALNYAVNVDSIVKNVLLGYGRRVPLLQVPESFGFNPDVKPYPYNPEKARRLLAEAGYPNGFDLDFFVPVGRYLMGKNVAEAISGYLAKVGVRAPVRTMEWGAVKRKIIARWRPETKPFIWYGARFDYPLDADWMMAMVTAKTAYGGFNDPELDRFIELGRRTTDRAKRLAVYHKMNKLLKEKAPVIFMHQESAIYGKRRHLIFERRYDGQFRLFQLDIRKAAS